MSEKVKLYKSFKANSDPFPFRVGKVRTAFPGWISGEKTIFDPRPKYDCIIWEEDDQEFYGYSWEDNTTNEGNE